MVKKVGRILCASILSFAMFFASPVYAEGGNFSIESVDIIDKSENVVAGTPAISGSTITSDTTFYAVNDYVTYKIVLKNNGELERKIVDITDDNENSLFDYEYDNHADEKIKTGENLTLELKVVYKNANTDDENRDYVSSVRFNITYVDIETKTETIEIVPAAPDTGSFNGVGISSNKDHLIALLIITGLGFITSLVLVIRKKGTAASKVAIASLMVITIVPLTVQAEESADSNFEIASTYKLRDRVKLSFRTILGDESKWESENYYDYGDEPFANTEESYYRGYSYRGAFNVSDNSRYNYAPLSDDVDINFVYDLEEYDITYDFNGGALKSGESNPNTYTVISNITLKKPVRDGYTFDGWFNENEKITTISDMVGDLELEARWTEIRIVPFFELTTMQEMTTAACNAATTPNGTTATYDTTGEHAGDRNYIPSVTLTDVRNQNTYQIAKLADGKCWMLENLSIADIELNSDTSDLADGETFTIPESSQSGFKSNATNSAYVDLEYGGYYTWYVATAGKGNSRGLKNSSICPKNWRLPSGDSSNNDYSTLYYTAYSRNYNNFQNAIKLQYGGYMNYNERYSAGRSGFYWENYADSLESVSYLSIYSSSSAVSVQGYTNNYNGDSIRCVAR